MTRSLKSPRFFRALCLIAILAAVQFASAALTGPLLKNAKYRGSDEVLVTAPGITLTEADLFQYMVLTGVGDIRDAVGWKKLNESQKAFIQIILDLRMYTELSAQKYQTPATPEDAALQIKGEEIMAFPAYRFVWGDVIAREKMNVFPEDITYYFKENAGLYSTPEMIVVRRLRVPTSSPLTIEVRNAALARAQSLRERALLEGGLAPLLMEDPSLLIDPPGKTVSFTRDVPGIDPQLVDEAFSLRVSQISRPIQTPAGFVLVEIMDHTLAEPFDRQKVAAEIKADLEKLQLGQQYDYQMLKAYLESYPVDRARLYEHMSQDTDLLNVGSFTLTVAEFAKLFPHIVGDPAQPNVVGIAGQTYEVITGEIARRDLTKRGLINDPFLEQSRELGRKIFRATQYARIRTAEIDPTEEELNAYIKGEPMELEPGNLKTVWAMRIAPRETGNFNQQQLDTLQILMQNYMDSAITEAEGKLTATRADLAIDEELDPDLALRSLTQPSDPRVRLRINEAGQYSRFDSQTLLGVRYESLLLDSFTPPLPLRDGSVVSYFVTAEKPMAKLPKPQLLAAARSLYTNSLIYKDELAAVKRWKEDGSLVYAEPLKTGKSFGAAVAADSATSDTLESARPEPAIVK